MRYQYTIALAVIAVVQPAAAKAQQQRAIEARPPGAPMTPLVDSSLAARIKALWPFRSTAEAATDSSTIAWSRLLRQGTVDCPMHVVRADSTLDTAMVKRMDAAGQARMPVQRPACTNSLNR